MNITELIKHLEALREKHGDLPCFIHYNDSCFAEEIESKYLVVCENPIHLPDAKGMEWNAEMVKGVKFSKGY